MNLKYTLDEYADIINSALKTRIPDSRYGESVVSDAMKYSLENGGKRIRPILTLEFCRVCGGDMNDALDFACAIEMIHTYSLIHDDMPCMDNDDMRRGKPSCHIKFGENFALLAGDALLTQAFAVIAESEAAKKNPAAAVKAIGVLSELSGVNGMVGGQVVDLKSEDKKVSVETLEVMDSLKTGALIKASCLLGVIAANGKEEFEKAAENYAENIGQAFQIVDDILDVTADEAQLGKPVGSDKQQNKSTYVSLLGLEQSQKRADELTSKAISSLDVFGSEGEFLKDLALRLAKRNK
ncbi:MAG: polyprenyl synthetase family protein [Acutalibacteraceae bacterium]